MSLTEPWIVVAGTAFDAPPAFADALPASVLPASGDRWMLLSFNLDSGWDCAETELHLAGATRPAQVWLNGQRLGDTPLPFIPAEFAVTRLLRPTGNVLALRLADSPATSPVPAWQGVVDPLAFTEPAVLGVPALAGFPARRIDRLRVWPDPRRKVVEVEASTNAPGRLHFRIDGLSIHHECDAGEARISIELPDGQPWAPGSPNLYTLSVDFVAEDGTADHARLPFALRELTVKEDLFHLNTRPIMVRGVWHAPVLDRATTYALLEDVRTARLNGLRLLWADEATFEVADALGILIFLQLPKGLDAHAAEALVQAYHHHPSLAAYWSVDGEVQALWQHDSTRMTLVTGPDAATPPCYYRPRKQQAETVQAYNFFAAPPFPVEHESYWKRIGADGALVLVEAMSAFGLESEPIVLPSALEGVFDTTADVLTASQSMQAEAVRYPIDAFRLNPHVAGYWIQGLTPFGAWPNSSLAHADGAPRPVLRILEALHRPMRPVVQMEKSSLCVREEVHVNIALLNDARLEGRGEVFLQVVGPTNQVLWKKRRQLRIPRHGKELWTGSVAASGSTGRHRFVVRLMQDEKVLGDSVFEFHVMEAPPEVQPKVHVVDPRGDFEPRVRTVARTESILAPVHVLPPHGDSIFTAPDNELMQSLAQVKGGAVLLVCSPPSDWNDLADRVEGLPRIDYHPLAGGGRLLHAFSRLHPVWEGLPARGFLRQPYRDVASVGGLLDETDEAIAGWYAPGSEHPTGNSIVSMRYGQGRIVFVCFRLLEGLGVDPLADRTFLNLVQHFARRAVPPRQPLPLEQRAVEWLRLQRKERLRRWAILGEFPNPNGQGYHTAYPPEQEVALDASYPGWRSLVRWRTWHTQANDLHTLDLAKAFSPPSQPTPRQDSSVGYAYTEFTSDRRLTATFEMYTTNACKAWLNGKLLLEQPKSCEREGAQDFEAEAVVKQGRNTLLVKLAKAPGPFQFRCEWSDHKGTTLPLIWWR
jgi:hypothetical protein